MKIIHLSTSTKGGAGIAAFRIHEALLKNGIDSHFICLNGLIPDPSASLFQKEKNHENIPPLLEKSIQRIEWRLKNHFKIQLSRKKRIEEEFRQTLPHLDCEIATLPFSDHNVLSDPRIQNADIIHLHWVAGFLDYPSFFKHNTKPVVWTLHDMNPLLGIFHYKEDEERNKTKTTVFDKDVASIKRKSIRRRKSALAIVAPSEWLLHEAASSKTFEDVKCECIYYPLDMEKFSARPNESLTASLKIPEGDTIFLFVAHKTNTQRKGFDLLVRALKNLNQQNITLLVIGSFKQAEYDGINIIQLGPVNDEITLSNYYSIADAFILPSREDNLPNVMLESLACGTPVISFDVGGMATIIKDGFNGLKAKKTNSEDLSNAIQQFINSKNTFNKDKIREYALAHFSEDLIAKKYRKVYEDLIESNA